MRAVRKKYVLNRSSIRTGIITVLAQCQLVLLMAQEPANRPDAATLPAPTATVVNTLGNYDPGIRINYVRSYTAKGPFTDPGVLVNQSNIGRAQQTDYLDGLGRPLQQVIREGGAGTSPGDIVQPFVYDPFGRESEKYLPYVSAGTDGNFKVSPLSELSGYMNNRYPGEQVFYSKTQYEPSPLNRVTKASSPGNSWTGSDRGVGMQYLVNTTTDQVVMWEVDAGGSLLGGQLGPGGYARIYPAGELFKNVMVDEQGSQVQEFKDKGGKVLLKRVQYKEGNSWLETYYVYDDLDQLRWVISPKGVVTARQSDAGGTRFLLDNEIINELCFQYRYDHRGRMIVKKVPGAVEVYMVYDKRDRLVFTQDGNLRGKSQWLVYLYDQLNRPAATALVDLPMTREALQGYVDGLNMNSSTVNAQSSSSYGNIANLQVNSREPGRPLYQAKESIEFLPGFTAEDGASFTAEIQPGNWDVFNNTVAVTGYPVPPGYSLNLLTLTYYDDYSWTQRTYQDQYRLKVDAGSNTYPEPLPTAAEQSQVSTRSLVTGTRIKVGDENGFSQNGAWITNVNFYDDKSRVIQTQVNHFKGGDDISTNLYNFSGALLSTFRVHNNPAAGVSNLRVQTNQLLDANGRVLEITKVINEEADKKAVIARHEYYTNGELSKKELGRLRSENGSYSSTPIETLDYSYNVRGWMTGLNKDLANSSHAMSRWFSMELSYDYGFEQRQYGGNISGIKWRSRGDDNRRAYGFGYDLANRILYADFNQANGTIWDKSAGVNFTSFMGNNGVDADQAYDENGNIRRMQQWGIKGVGSTQVDGLSYGYMAKSNKLRNVLEDPGINDTDTKLGDFRVSSRSLAVTPNRDASVTDYLYDINGNLTEDRNKDLIGAGTGSGIVYNHLNLPIQVRVAADAANNVKGMIRYRYDAAGNKLEKLVNEPASAANQQVAKETGTVYLADFVYENNKLQFFGQEEGRVRKVIDPDTQAESWVYDYFVKDHLGNVRMVLTDERKVKVYPPATMEVARAADEEALYRNMQTRASLPAGYPVDHYVTPNERAAKVGGTSGKLGPGILLKVMSGDKFNVTVSSWYRLNGTNGTTSSKPIQDIVEALAAGIAPLSNIKVTQQQLLGGPLTSQVGSFLNSQNNQNANNVKAGLHWILLDEQFKIVSGASGFESVPDESVFQNGTPNPQVYRHVRPNLQVPKNGYLYVYVANETDNVSVYFDNLQVSHVPGPLVEETHYYPFGLTMAGISSKALNSSPENKYKFNKGSELQNKEFSDGSGLELYATPLRTLDPQIGRWHQIDSKPDYAQSLYSSMGNNPILYNDPLGDTTVPGAGFWKNLVGGVKDGGLETTGFVRGLGTTQGWKNLGNGLLDMADRVNPISPTGIFKNIETGNAVANYVSNIPNMSKDQIGHDLGYGLEKTAETVVLSKGAGMVGKAMQGAKTETVFRVFGGDAKAEGFSWTPKNPNSVSNFRDAAGLPSGGASGSNNTGRFVIEGTVKKKNIMQYKSADPLDGNKGGLLEYKIDPKNVQFKRVSGVNPQF